MLLFHDYGFPRRGQNTGNSRTSSFRAFVCAEEPRRRLRSTRGGGALNFGPRRP